MKYKIILLCISAIIISGCSSVKTQKVIVYGPKNDISIKQDSSFSEACRAVLGKFGSFYSQSSKDIRVMGINSYKACYKAIDNSDYEYIIAVNGKREGKLIVTLKTTNPDSERFINAFYGEFNARGIEFEEE